MTYHTRSLGQAPGLFVLPTIPKLTKCRESKFPVAQNDILCYAFRSAAYVAMSLPQSVAAWRFLYEAIMPKWFSCLVESIGVGFIMLAVLMALFTFFVEKCS